MLSVYSTIDLYPWSSHYLPIIPFLSHYHPGGKRDVLEISLWLRLKTCHIQHAQDKNPSTKLQPTRFPCPSSHSKGWHHLCLPLALSLIHCSLLSSEAPLVTSHLFYPKKFSTCLFMYSFPHLQTKRRESKGVDSKNWGHDILLRSCHEAKCKHLEARWQFRPWQTLPCRLARLKNKELWEGNIRQFLEEDVDGQGHA